MREIEVLGRAAMALQKCGSIDRLRVLSALRDAPGRTAAELAETLHAAGPTFVLVRLEPLLTHGLVSREGDGGPQCPFRWHVTPVGLRCLDVVESVREAMQAGKGAA